MTKAEYADQMHNCKYNCCQAVVCAYADEVGMDKRTLFRMAEGFGLGMGCMEGICGALSGAVMLAGVCNSDGDLEDPRTKKDTYKLSKEMFRVFKEKTGGLICRELKGIDTGVKLCSCPDCIRAGVETAQEVLGLPAE